MDRFRQPDRRSAAVAAALALLTLALFLPLAGADFAALDDDVYVADNPRVLGGLTSEGVRWAFASFGYQGNWHPLTWLSHMLDAQLFGRDPRGHHATNLALHAANTALLFSLLRALSGALWPSALAAALFGVHPMHVETVAWIADRKGLLSTLFWLLATAAWLRHVRRPGQRWLLWSGVLLAAGLLAKPMPVSAPLTLLLLDVWPLGRLGAARGAPPGRQLRRLLWEKAPLAALAAASAVATYLAQRQGGAVAFAGLEHGWVRAGDALVGCARYLGLLLWPAGLSVLYPHPRAYYGAAAIASAGVLVGALSAAALLLRRRAPAAAVGWGWFLVTLVPVSGLVQVGAQSIADRYTYVPYVGLFVAVVWGGASLLETHGARRPAAPVAAVSFAALAALAALAGASRARLSDWRDGETLLARAVAVSPENWIARTNLGRHLLDRGRADEAIAQFLAALRANPDDFHAAYNLGIALAGRNRLEDAAEQLRRALRVNPGSSEAHNNLGAVLFRQGRLREAAASFSEAVRLGPGNREARANLATATEALRREQQREAAAGAGGGPGAGPPRGLDSGGAWR